MIKLFVCGGHCRRRRRRCCCLTIEEVDHQLVGAHHDGGVGDLAHQVCGEAAVQRAVALLPDHRGQSLEKGAVLGALLS